MPAVMEAIDAMTTAEKFETMNYLWSSLSSDGNILTSDWQDEVAKRCKEVECGEVPLVPFDESLRRAFGRLAEIHSSAKVVA